MRNTYNDFIKIESYLNNHDKIEELKGTDETGSEKYLLQCDFKESDFEIFQDLTLDQINIQKDKICHELTLMMSSILININMNLSQSGVEENDFFFSSSYSTEFVNNLLEKEMENDLIQTLNFLYCKILRCSLLQILLFVPKLVNFKCVIAHLTRLSTEENTETESQLTLSLILQ
mmetsp:Transcript_25772/g.22866  ORF Transcript_25772/g.22866 Transcript_25772/m.22866 type:complete len:175 (+) Transcript_25772:705-1229(+)